MGDKLSLFVKCFLSSVFAGFCAVLCCLAFDIIYRFSTGYDDATLYNVSALIIGCFMIMLVTGIIFYLLKSALKGSGGIAHTVVMLIITAICIFAITGANWDKNPISNSHFHVESAVIFGIIGGISAFVMPALFNNEKFNTIVSDSEEAFAPAHSE